MVPLIFRAYLAKLLSKHGCGISLEKFAAFFKNSTKERIKYELYGYASLAEMFEDLNDVCRVERTKDKVELYPVNAALELKGRYRLDRRVPPAGRRDVLRKEITTHGEVILLDIENRFYVPTCCLAQLAGFTSDQVLEILERDGLRVTGVRYLSVGNPDHEKFRLKIALWCPLARSKSDQIQEKIALVPLESCDFVVASLSPDIPQDNAVRKLRIMSSFKMN